MTIAIDRHLDVTPGTRGGRPRIAGRRVTVDDIVILHLRLGQSIDQIAATYDLSHAAVHAALAYYYDHRDDVEARIAADEAFLDAFQKKNPSKLQERLKALRNG